MDGLVRGVSTADINNAEVCTPLTHSTMEAVMGINAITIQCMLTYAQQCMHPHSQPEHLYIYYSCVMGTVAHFSFRSMKEILESSF